MSLSFCLHVEDSTGCVNDSAAAKRSSRFELGSRNFCLKANERLHQADNLAFPGFRSGGVLDCNGRPVVLSLELRLYFRLRDAWLFSVVEPKPD